MNLDEEKKKEAKKAKESAAEIQHRPVISEDAAVKETILKHFTEKVMGPKKTEKGKKEKEKEKDNEAAKEAPKEQQPDVSTPGTPLKVSKAKDA